MVGGDENEGPPGYDSSQWHKQMLQEGHLYTYLSDNGQILGGAILFEGNNELYIGRIFIDPQYFRCGYGMKLMEEIEKTFDDYMKKWCNAKYRFFNNICQIINIFYK